MSWLRTLLLTLDVDAPYGRVLMGSLTDTSLLNQPPDFIVGDKFLLQIQLAQRAAVTTSPATPADPPAGTHFVFSGKAAGGSGSLLFYADAWSQCLDAEEEPIPGRFEAVLDLNTTEFAAHIAASPTGAKTLLGEIEIQNADNSERRSLQFDLTGRPQVYVGTETQPVGGSDPFERGYNAPDFRPALTALTGGTADALDALPTAALTAGYVVMFIFSGSLRSYLLTADDSAEDAPGIIRPDDFAEGTNEKVWIHVADCTPDWSAIAGKPATFPPTIGSGAGDAVAGNDARLTDDRNPTAHKASHATGQADAIAPSDIGAEPAQTPVTISAAANVTFGITVGGSITHALPASPSIGNRVKYYITASGANRNLNFDAAILRPSDSAMTLPKVMTSGKTYIVQFEYNGTAWLLTTVVGGY